MTSDARQFDRCEQAMYGVLRVHWRAKLAMRVTGKTEAELENFARNCMLWTEDTYNAGTMDVAVLRAKVREKCKQEYGSILVAILFAVLWEIIKAWLFN